MAAARDVRQYITESENEWEGEEPAVAVEMSTEMFQNSKISLLNVAGGR